MEKRAVIAFGLILLIWVAVSTPFYQKLMYGTPPPSPADSLSSLNTADTTDVSDTARVIAPSRTPKMSPETPEATPEAPSRPRQGSWDRPERLISLHDTTSVVQRRRIVVEGDLFRGVLDTRGGVLRSWRLKRYRGVDSPWVELIPENREGSPGVRLSSEAGMLEFSQALFSVSRDSLKLSDAHPSGTVELRYRSSNGLELVKRYTFSNDDYAFRLDVELTGADQARLGSKYFMRWGSGLRVTEPDRKRDLSSFRAFAELGDEVEQQNLGSSEFESKQFTGETGWVGVRSKYFFAGMVPLDRPGAGCSLSGRPFEQTSVPDRQVAAEIGMELSPALHDRFMIYLGPVDYDLLAKYDLGLEGVVDLGWTIIRPISFVILHVLVWMHQWILNYGLVIILLSIGIKVILYPLTYKSMMATQGMQALGPEMEKLKEKYKKDTQRLNKEMMGLYKKHGVNPLGGCLPMLLQMPILYGLYNVFGSTIELRGAPFWLWIDDLSRGASSFTDPYIVLPLLMSATMFVQSKMTMKDPRQAALAYMMPVMLFVFMHSLPSGLILYWTMVNVLTIAQQYLQNRFIGTTPVRA